MREPAQIRERLGETRESVDEGIGSDAVRNRLEGFAEALEWVLDEEEDGPISLRDREVAVYGSVVDEFLLDAEMRAYLDAVVLAGKASGSIRYEIMESDELGRYVLLRQELDRVYERNKDL